MVTVIFNLLLIDGLLVAQAIFWVCASENKKNNLKTGYRPSLLQALLRAILRIGSEVFFYLGFIMAFMMPLKQTFHDKLSNCVVIDA